jgi:hypothetical protein
MRCAGWLALLFMAQPQPWHLLGIYLIFNEQPFGDN